MRNRLPLHAKKYSRSSRWRDYQSRLKKKDAKQLSFRRIPLYAGFLCVLVLTVYGVFFLLDKTLRVPPKNHSLIFSDPGEKFDKNTLQKIIGLLPFTQDTKNRFELHSGGNHYQINTSIDPSLQKFIIDRIDRKNSKFFGFVAMEANTGRILSMVSYDKNKTGENTCTNPDYPAASIFKIITSAAAIETCGYNCNTPVTFNGNKYTLYKNQLKNRSNKYTNRISFKKAFAESVNPVFGKIGAHHLGQSVLESYAGAFGFNRTFDFEIPLGPSSFVIDDDPYSWAEIASGFNKKTSISPLHGALMVSIILNNGKLVEPTLIDKISHDGRPIYRRGPHTTIHVIDPSTAATLKKLMNATITSGTAAKSFSGFKNDGVLSRLHIGGKTGSINNNAKKLKYDWFTGFAEEKTGSERIVTSVLVVHEKFIGTRAAHYSRMAIKEYYKNYYADSKTNDPVKKAALL